MAESESPESRLARAGYTISLLSSLKPEERRPFFEWWADRLAKGDHTISMTAQGLEEEVVEGTVVLCRGEFAGASAIFKYRTKDGAYLEEYKGKKVVELGSNFIGEAHRSQGIASQQLRKRLEVCREQHYFTIVIANHPNMQKALRKLGAESMHDKPEMKSMLEAGCFCEDVTEPCGICPLRENGAWYFDF